MYSIVYITKTQTYVVLQLVNCMCDIDMHTVQSYGIDCLHLEKCIKSLDLDLFC